MVSSYWSPNRGSARTPNTRTADKGERTKGERMVVSFGGCVAEDVLEL